MPLALSQNCRVVVSGNLVRDTIVRPVEELRFGSTIWVEAILPSIGGNGANTAFALATLGCDATLISACGADEAGNACLAELRKAGVYCRVPQHESLATAQTVAIVHPEGERCFLHQPGVNRHALDGAIVFNTPPLETGEVWAMPDGQPWHYHLANPFALPAFRGHAAESVSNARALGATTSLDTGWDSQGRWMEDIAPCLPLLDLLFVNDREGEHLTGMREAGQMVSVLHRAGAKRIVLKLGEQGCLVSDEEDREVVPAFPVTVTDTTGAGDVFVAGFLAGLIRQMPSLEAARFACAVGALSVQDAGSVRGLRDFDGTRAWMAEQDADW